MNTNKSMLHSAARKRGFLSSPVPGDDLLLQRYGQLMDKKSSVSGETMPLSMVAPTEHTKNLNAFLANQQISDYEYDRLKFILLASKQREPV